MDIYLPLHNFINNMNYIKKLKERWKSKPPYFWIKVRNLPITIGTSAVVIVESGENLIYE